jgi:hypothetical protein
VANQRQEQLCIHPSLLYSEYLRVGFRHGGNFVTFVGFFSIEFPIDSKFHPVTWSTKGETIHAGAICLIEWNVSNLGHSGRANTLLKKGEISDIAGYVATISRKYNIVFAHSV